jgi:hypothetical protein
MSAGSAVPCAGWAQGLGGGRSACRMFAAPAAGRRQRRNGRSGAGSSSRHNGWARRAGASAAAARAHAYAAGRRVPPLCMMRGAPRQRRARGGSKGGESRVRAGRGHEVGRGRGQCSTHSEEGKAGRPRAACVQRASEQRLSNGFVRSKVTHRGSRRPWLAAHSSAGAQETLCEGGARAMGAGPRGGGLGTARSSVGGVHVCCHVATGGGAALRQAGWLGSDEEGVAGGSVKQRLPFGLGEQSEGAAAPRAVFGCGADRGEGPPARPGRKEARRRGRRRGWGAKQGGGEGGVRWGGGEGRCWRGRNTGWPGKEFSGEQFSPQLWESGRTGRSGGLAGRRAGAHPRAREARGRGAARAS